MNYNNQTVKDVKQDITKVFALKTKMILSMMSCTGTV
jgi:hypothetical protein